MSQRAKELLLGGADYIEKHGWTQGKYGTFTTTAGEKHGPACIIGACAAAVGVTALNLPGTDFSKIIECFGKVHRDAAMGPIGPVQFNDHMAKSAEEVVEAMRHAASHCE